MKLSFVLCCIAALVFCIITLFFAFAVWNATVLNDLHGVTCPAWEFGLCSKSDSYLYVLFALVMAILFSVLVFVDRFSRYGNEPKFPSPTNRPPS